jgi:uncharacterized repeat protein (TIGR01451 family)/LPXTG-motif cell wall-anchored protein
MSRSSSPTHPRRRFRTALSAATALFVAFATVIVAVPATAAPVSELTARWAEEPPATVASGDVLNAEWRVNLNDDAAAPSNAPVDDIDITLTLDNGVFAELPDACLVDDVTPASSISEDGATLVCNIGTQNQGTAHVIQTAVRVSGPTGSQVTGAGTIDGATADLTPVDISNPFGMDMKWSQPTGSTSHANGVVEVDFQWTLNLLAGSDPGPDSISYTLNMSSSTGAPVSAFTCRPFTTADASGHPWSGGGHAADQTAPFVDSCTVTPTGTPGVYTMTVSGIDYSRDRVPARDSSGNLLPVDRTAVASGSVVFRVPSTVNVSVELSASAPTYRSALDPTVTAQDEPGNNTASKVWTVDGSWASAFIRYWTGSGGNNWDDTYRLAPGSTVMVHNNSRLHVNVPASTPISVCTAIDTAYMRYSDHDTLFTGPSGQGFFPDYATVYYYVGNDPRVVAASGSYDPRAFSLDCSADAGNWTTERPADLSTIKALRMEYHAGDAPTTTNVVLRPFLTIREDAPNGTDIWTLGSFRVGTGSWTEATGPVTRTPDARYPFTTAGRDLLRVVRLTPFVQKTVDRSAVKPGDIATFTVAYSANGGEAAPETIDDYVLTDTLPAGVTYVPGSANPEPAVDGQQLTWNLDGVTTNTVHSLSYQVTVDGTVEPGSTLTNVARATVDGQESAPASAQMTVDTYGLTSIGKSADMPFIPNLDGDGVGAGSWTVTLRSQDPTTQGFTDAIDIFPYNGDGRGTSYNGTYALTGVDAVPGATVYYTDADPGTLSDDPDDATNGAAGTIAGNTVGWSTTMPENPTAARVIGPELAPGATQAFRVAIETDGVEGGDTLVNRAQARTEHTELVMRTSAPITVANYYSASLKKYVQGADGEWHDANTVEDYPSYKPGDTIPYRIVIENTGQGTLTNLVITDDLFPEGSFAVGELAPGAQETHEFDVALPAGTTDTVVNTACAAADIPEDSGIVPTINCDPAGIELTGDPTHTKSLVSAAPTGDGQWEIVYALDVSNASTSATSYSVADTLHFSDQIDIVSASVTSTPDGVELADPAWDGQSNVAVASDVALLGTDDEGYTPHRYLLTVVADVPLQFAPGGTPPSTECAADGEDTDTAFNNTSEMTSPDTETQIDQACATPPSISIDKSVASGPTPNDDGTWTVTYNVVATNDGGADGVYDVTDRMTADGDLDVVSSSVTGFPDGITVNDGWTGVGAEGSEENIIASDVTLPAGETQTYEVTVVVGIADGVEGAPVITECSADPSENGGLSNTAEIEHNDLTADDSACITVGTVTVDKSVAAGPTPNGDGTWTVVYDIVATHVGAAEAVYDVTDRLHFGEGIEITGHEVRSPDDIPVSSDWTGLGDADTDAENLIAENVTMPVGGTHTYQVEVTIQMDEDTFDPTQLECAAPGSGGAGGLGNSTTLTSNGIMAEDDVCPTVPMFEIEKQIVEGSPVANGDGTWTITYDVTSTNVGQAEGDYDLSDRLRYGNGIVVESTTIVGAPVEANSGWTGQGMEGSDENVIVEGQSLAPGDSHTFRIVVVASLDQAVVTPADLECPAPGSEEAGGFSNTAVLVHNGEDQDAEACVSAPLIEITKSLSGAVTPVEGEVGHYDATYEITVTNSGAGAGIYNLDDQLAPGEGVTVVGIEDVSTDAPDAVGFNESFNGLNDIRIVTGQAIEGATAAPVVHTYTVTVRYAADLTGIKVPTGDTCTTDSGEALPGTLNNTATVDWNGIGGEDAECIVPGNPTLDKAIVSAAAIGGGQWEVVYDLTVGNTGDEATTYDLDDDLLFAPQITVDSVSVSGPDGIEINDAFDGGAVQRIATGVGILGLDDEGYAPHVYRVTVVADVPLTFDENDIGSDGTGSPACTVPSGGNLIEQGLNNAATLTNETGGTIVDTDCAGVPSTRILKTMDGAPVAGSGGLWTVNYTVQVSNDGPATGIYTVTDQLRYGTGIEVLDATVTAPDGVTPAASWTGLGDTGADENIIAADVALAAGEMHTYHVTVETRLDTDAADRSAITCPAPGSGDRGGFANTAGLSENDLTDTSSACDVPEWPEDVPPPLATTGGELTIGAITAGLLLLIGGGMLVHLRRRREVIK